MLFVRYQPFSPRRSVDLLVVGLLGCEIVWKQRECRSTKKKKKKSSKRVKEKVRIKLWMLRETVWGIGRENCSINKE